MWSCFAPLVFYGLVVVGNAGFVEKGCENQPDEHSIAEEFDKLHDGLLML